MNGNASTVGSLPVPVKLAGVLGVFGVTLAGAYAYAQDVGLLLIVGGGLVFVSMLVGLVYLWRAKGARVRDRLIRMGMPLGAPTGVSDKSKIAQMEALRREFQGGLEKFRNAGRSLYETPWYLIVGESGGGKTEAIRHSQVRFIPGLQNFLQGVGGTLNMNWWFTREAILLDTAGRILAEEVEAGSTNEWTEFLRLLRDHRRDCPINGLLLVIPADTLMKDAPAEIDKKASVIAAKFEQLQQVLGVRFPVFVIISKCDLIGGFSEFFENLNDSQQNQILGWSNPRSLDAEFDPKLVDDHLETVRQRLVRRRMRRLVEPRRGEEGTGRRLDHVDALYSLPDNMKVLAPRLRQYLETVFVAGTWSKKPLFLRGIYFSSSFQKGSPLDLDLASALGISVADLPAEEERNEKRTYFLRDLFMEKVFPEKGLVTRVVNVDALQRKRKVIMLGGAIAATMAFLALTWFQFKQLNNHLKDHVTFWGKVSRMVVRPAVNPDTAAYRPQVEFVKENNEPDDETVPLTALLEESRKLAEPGRDVRVPAMFKPIARLRGDPNAERLVAHRALVEGMLLRPLLTAVREKMAKETVELWDESDGNATAALRELIRLERGGPSGPGAWANGLDVLMRYRMAKPQYTDIAKTDVPALGRVVQWTATPRPPGGGAKWTASQAPAGAGDAGAAGTAAAAATPASSLGVGTQLSQEVVLHGVRQFIGRSQRAAQRERSTGTTLAPVLRLHRALGTYRRSEQALVEMVDAQVRAVPADEAEYQRRADAFRTLAAAVRDATEELNGALAGAGGAGGWDGSAPLSELFRARYEELVARHRRELEEMRDQIGAEPPQGPLRQAWEALDKAAKEAPKVLEEGSGDGPARQQVMDDLQRLQAQVLERVRPPAWFEAGGAQPSSPDGKVFAFAVRARGLERVVAHLAEAEKPVELDVAAAGVRARSAAAAEAVRKYKDELRVLESTAASPTAVAAGTASAAAAAAGAEGAVAAAPGAALARVGRSVLDYLAEPIAHRRLAQAALARLPSSANADAYAKAVAERAGGKGLTIPAVPLTVSGERKTEERSFAPQFDPREAKALRALVEDLTWLLGGAPGQPAPTAAPPALVGGDELRAALKGPREGWEAYARSYVDYWLRDVAANELRLIDWDTYGDFRDAVGAVRGWQVQAALKAFTDAQADAIAPFDASKAEQVRADAKAVADPRFDKVSEDLLRAWADLGVGADAGRMARQALLSMETSKFKRDLVLVPQQEGAHRTYWAQIAQAGLRAVATESRAHVDAALKQLPELMRFPLVRPGDMKANEKPLTEAQVAKARELIQRDIRGAVASAGGAGGAAAAGAGSTTLQGADLGQWSRDAELAPLAPYVKVLRGEGLVPPGQVAWIDAASKLLDALPAGAPAAGPGAAAARLKPMPVTIAFDKALLGGDTSGAIRFSNLQPKAGGKEVTVTIAPGNLNADRFNLFNEARQTFEAMLPGPALAFQFVGAGLEGAKGPEVNVPEAMGPWSALWLLHATNATIVEPPSGAAERTQRWQVRLSAGAGAATSWTLITLEFDTRAAARPEARLPSLADWPRRP